MKSGFLQTIAFLFLHAICLAQNVEDSYRFTNNFSVAEPACAPDLLQVNALGSCTLGGTPGAFVADNLDCQISRTVYHTNLNYGLMYSNTAGTVSETYTIQMYIKNTRWGKTWARIIDFSNGQLDEGIYFKDIAGSNDRCIDFFPTGIAGDCPYFKLDKYYLLTFTRNGQTGVMDVYVNDKLFVSYDDSGKKYVGKTGVPIYIFRDDNEVSCESGEANFAFLSFTNYYSSQTLVSKDYQNICSVANINVSADFSIDPAAVCGNKNVKVAYTGVLPSATGYSFHWNFDGAKIISGSDKGPFLLHWNEEGNKKITLTIKNEACGKEISNTKPAYVSFMNISVDIDDSKCDGQATLTVNPKNGISPFQFSIDSINYQALNVFNVTAKDYKIFVKDYNGCINDTLITVKLNGGIELKTISDTTICIGQEIQLLTTANVTNYSWTPAAGLDNAAALEPFASPQQTTQYIITATDKGCSSQDTVAVTVIPEIKVIVTPDSDIPPNTPFQLISSSPQLTGISGVSYSWSPPYGLSNPAIANPNATLSASQVYSVILSTPQGCSGTGQVTLTVIPPASITLPDIFTPDGDGKNEMLTPITNRIASLNYLRIYNRWGEVIYFSKQLSQGWDGKTHGIKSDSGVYVWKMEAVTTSGEIVSRSGTVLLVR
ncbi:gliding motility-associated C-terminal domain-containing protein [Dyadobacter subterraneus]|uniref:Gliding motility-associated C-terminal domain-containing protein n=1 Tax=Dyadobacter subterraneus TaxID=2773304 RepID=A0ABR9WJG3_9BACT|nr:gliding motility-associated C-terminal domain-containing protein [Dyadobacter subterraneus]MBE9465557.1 gliding motility-associated C-terminal domain-containing protein [Dyadobacter subterraneus]